MKLAIPRLHDPNQLIPLIMWISDKSNKEIVDNETNNKETAIIEKKVDIYC